MGGGGAGPGGTGICIAVVGVEGRRLPSRAPRAGSAVKDPGIRGARARGPERGPEPGGGGFHAPSGLRGLGGTAPCALSPGSGRPRARGPEPGRHGANRSRRGAEPPAPTRPLIGPCCRSQSRLGASPSRPGGEGSMDSAGAPRHGAFRPFARRALCPVAPLRIASQTDAEVRRQRPRRPARGRSEGGLRLPAASSRCLGALGSAGAAPAPSPGPRRSAPGAGGLRMPPRCCRWGSRRPPCAAADPRPGLTRPRPGGALLRERGCRPALGAAPAGRRAPQQSLAVSRGLAASA